jgi:uncharacterized membrane protein YoaK (UPF0700 family)
MSSAVRAFLNHRNSFWPAISEQRMTELGVDLPVRPASSASEARRVTSPITFGPIAVTLSVVAGYVDSCTYLGLFGVFVAQLTGSFVIVGTAFVNGGAGTFAKILAIPSFFFSGLAITMLVHSMRKRPRAALTSSLLVECILLAGLSVSCCDDMPFRSLGQADAIVALLFGMAAMGAQSALVRLLIRGVGSTNVMTTNTTLLAIYSAEILLDRIGRNKAGRSLALNAEFAGARREIVALLPIWLGFLTGTVLGATAYTSFGVPCVSFAILPVGGLALLYIRPDVGRGSGAANGPSQQGKPSNDHAADV